MQGLRGIAVAVVVAFHAGLPLTGGYAGVDIFFVISGFVITRLLWRELHDTGRLDLADFYGRRARRLLPALAVLLPLVLASSVLLMGVMGPVQQTAKVGAGASLFVANVPLYLMPTGYFNAPNASVPLLHTWSLAVEEQFYLVFPALMFLSWRIWRRFGARMGARAFCTLIVAATSLLSLMAQLALLHMKKFEFYASPLRAWEFGAGALIALFEPSIERLSRPVASLLSAAGLAGVAVTAVAFTSQTVFPGYAALLPVASSAALIAGGTAGARGTTRLLSNRVLVRLGDLSYGWYLWHWPLIVFTQVLWRNAGTPALTAASLVSLVPTWLSYRYVEAPLRYDQRFRGRGAVRLAAVCVSIPLVMAVALLVGTNAAVSNSRALSDLKHAYAFHEDVRLRCNEGVPIGQTSSSCTWNVPDAKGTAVLVGDSNAGQFTEPFVAAARAQHLDALVGNMFACPFADLKLQATDGNASVCRDFVVKSMAGIRRIRPSVVVIASSSTNYLADGSGVTFTDPATGRSASSPRGLSSMWTIGIGRMLQEVASSGARVVLIHTVPHIRGFDLGTCPGFRVYSDASSCNMGLSRSAVEAFQARAMKAELRAMADVPGVKGVDFTNDICGPTRCDTLRGGTWWYRDESHLSIEGALKLTGRFEQILDEATRTT